MSWIDTKIASCRDWKEFRSLAESQRSEKDKGDLFERLTQLYLQTSSTYRTQFKNVWWCNNSELPEAIRKKLNLPRGDEGIDLVCEAFDGKFWSVQCKYRTNSNRPLNTKELSKFSSLSFVTCKNIEGGLIVHTSAKKVKKSELLGNSIEIGLQHWLAIAPKQWEKIIAICKGNKLQEPEKRQPRKHQKVAIKKVKEHFTDKKVSRGKLIMPCGTGKSLTAFWMAQELKAKTIVVAVPSLALVKQSLEDWTTEYLAEGIKPAWLAVCSDDSVGKMKETDSTVATVYEAGIPVTTKSSEIVDFIKKRTSAPRVIFTTYQSSPMLSHACNEAGLKIDLLIADEAHKTVGRKDRKFSTLLFDENIRFKKRIFMTATERVYRQGSDDIVSMSDPKIYGKTIHEMSFKEAIDDGIICDYKILTISVSEEEVSQLMEDHADIQTQLGNQNIETDAHNLAAGIALQKAFSKYGITHALSFHRSIDRAKLFAKQQDIFSDQLGNFVETKNRTISSRLSAGQRSQMLHDFTEDNLALITNARCLTEGVDIPSIDCVTFVDPKQSTIDIVQAAGRAMRQSKATGKKYGYILIPVIVPTRASLAEHLASTDFKAVAKVITTLSTHDKRIVDELKNKAKGKKGSSGNIILEDTDIIRYLNVGYEEFAENLNLTIWKSVGSANWIAYEEARELVRKQSFSTAKEFRKWVKSSERPHDLPTSPEKVYNLTGWSTWADFLGTDTISSWSFSENYYSYEEARKFVRALGLKNQKEWGIWALSSDRPPEIPYQPERAYADKGWIGLADWLGTDYIPHKDRVFLPFEQARSIARSKKMKANKEWRVWAKSSERPLNIPSKPDRVYKEKGWIGWGDWLGTGKRATKTTDFLPFEEARAFARKLNLKLKGTPKQDPKKLSWINYVKGNLKNNLGLKPDNIPAAPDRYYKKTGWVSYADWLDSNNLSGRQRADLFLPFEDARKIVRNKKFSSRKEFKNWCSKERPQGIPSNPNKVYKKDGWISMHDWLGKKQPEPFQEFKDARKFARSLGLTSASQWRKWASSSNRPTTIPYSPEAIYKHSGWIDFYDWLGNEKPTKKS